MSVLQNVGVQVAEYDWDFSVDGGAAAAYNLDAKDGKSPVPTGALIKDVYAFVATAVTSAGSLTAEWGSNSDADGFSGTAVAKAALTLGSVHSAAAGDAALLWDGTNDHMIILPVDGSTEDGSVDFTVNVAAATAGVVQIMVEYYQPTDLT